MDTQSNVQNFSTVLSAFIRPCRGRQPVLIMVVPAIKMSVRLSPRCRPASEGSSFSSLAQVILKANVLNQIQLMPEF